MQDSRIDHLMKQTLFFYGAKCVKRPGFPELEEWELIYFQQWAKETMKYRYYGHAPSQP